MVQDTQLHLPKEKNVPVIVVCWNCSKGRICEITRYLDLMYFYFDRGMSSCQLTPIGKNAKEQFSVVEQGHDDPINDEALKKTKTQGNIHHAVLFVVQSMIRMTRSQEFHNPQPTVQIVLYTRATKNG